MTANQVIHMEYGYSQNFMTPIVVEIGWAKENEIAYEISLGTGFKNERIYGLSLVRLEQGKTNRIMNESSMYHSMNQLRETLSELA